MRRRDVEMTDEAAAVTSGPPVWKSSHNVELSVHDAGYIVHRHERSSVFVMMQRL